VTRQCAGTAPAGATQAHSVSVTADTGSPIAAGSIDVPKRAALQSSAVTSSGVDGGWTFGLAVAAKGSNAAAALRARVLIDVGMCMASPEGR
jgi:hypothetical protein